MSFVTSDDAAKALYFLVDKKHEGAINVASPLPLSLKRFIQILEKRYQQKAILATEADEKNHSPYGIEKDWFICTEVLQQMGLTLVDIESWLIDFCQK